MRIGVFAVIVSGLAFAQTAIAAPINTCVDVGVPVGGIVDIQCTVYSNGSPDTFNLQPLMTQGGALLSNNDYGAAYYPVINADPTTLADNSSGLWNQSLWQAVIYFAGGDPDGAFFSDSLQVFWPGAFPTMSTIQSLDLASYTFFNGGSATGYTDLSAFIEATGSTTVVQGPNGAITLITTPEPSSIVLMLSGMLGLGLLVGRKSLLNLRQSA